MSKLKIEITTDRKDSVKIESDSSGDSTVKLTVLKQYESSQEVASIRLNKQGLRRLRDSLSVTLTNFESLI